MIVLKVLFQLLVVVGVFVIYNLLFVTWWAQLQLMPEGFLSYMLTFPLMGVLYFLSFQALYTLVAPQDYHKLTPVISAVRQLILFVLFYVFVKWVENETFPFLLEDSMVTASWMITGAALYFIFHSWLFQWVMIRCKVEHW